MSMLIIVRDVVPDISTNAGGDILFRAIHRHLSAGELVFVSFKGIYALNTSFVNSSFIELLNHYDLSYLKKHVFIRDSTNYINQLILQMLKEANS